MSVKKIIEGIFNSDKINGCREIIEDLIEKPQPNLAEDAAMLCVDLWLSGKLSDAESLLLFHHILKSNAFHSKIPPQ